MSPYTCVQTEGHKAFAKPCQSDLVLGTTSFYRWEVKVHSPNSRFLLCVPYCSPSWLPWRPRTIALTSVSICGVCLPRDFTSCKTVRSSAPVSMANICFKRDNTHIKSRVHLVIGISRVFVGITQDQREEGSSRASPVLGW